MEKNIDSDLTCRHTCSTRKVNYAIIESLMVMISTAFGIFEICVKTAKLNSANRLYNWSYVLRIFLQSIIFYLIECEFKLCALNKFIQ